MRYGYTCRASLPDTGSEPLNAAAPFALGTFSADDAAPFAGIVLAERVASLVPELGESTTIRGLVDRWDESLPRLQEIANRLAGQRLEHALEELRPLPPLRPPGQIFQAGANYRQHVLDLMAGADRRGDESDGLTSSDRERARDELDKRLTSGRPFVFLGSANSMIGAHDDVILPFDSHQHDWELELAAVIGRPARRLGSEHALAAVAGYTICNDITTRDALIREDTRSLGLDWLAGKNAPTFLPTGPLFVPACHAGDPMDLRITLKVNGAAMQDESTADMVFGVAALIEFISTVAELRPGDLVLTGSPAGNGASHGTFLKSGDVMEGSITGLGTQRNACVAEVSAESHAAA
jgi:2-keto-4-pentenoate hydratase/2-oxohepta-3-ene-1,7-dioic acid hydratase in catechol pathway